MQEEYKYDRVMQDVPSHECVELDEERTTARSILRVSGSGVQEADETQQARKNKCSELLGRIEMIDAGAGLFGGMQWMWKRRQDCESVLKNKSSDEVRGRCRPT